MANDFNPGIEPVAQTGAPNVQTEVARNGDNATTGAGALMQALGTQGTQQALAQFNEMYEQRRLQEQTAKVGAYTQQFMQDHQDGAVSQAQLKQKFPEMVPVIAARVAESIGKQRGAQQFQSVIDQVNNDDSLRLDTAARQDFLNKAKAGLFSQIPQGNDFYASGVASAMNETIAQNEARWQGQTAQYHTQVQADSLGKEVTDAFVGTSGNPQAFADKLGQIDTNWSSSSSLNNLERNKIYVDQAIKYAAVSDDPNILKQIPDRYLNTDSKEQIRMAGIQIMNQRFANWNHQNELIDYQRKQQTRQAKIQINTDIANGANPNPAQYLSDPEAHEYAVSAMTQPRVAADTSAAAMTAFKNSILNTATLSGAGSLEDLTTAALHIPSINPTDRAALVAELPSLMDGRIALKEPRVESTYTTRIGSRLEMLSKSIPATLASMNGLGALTAQARSMYDNEIRNSYGAYYESNGKQWPRGKDAQDLIDRAADRVSTFMDHKSSLDAISEMGSKPAPGGTSAAPSGKPAAATNKPAPALPKGVTKIN